MCGRYLGLKFTPLAYTPLPPLHARIHEQRKWNRPACFRIHISAVNYAWASLFILKIIMGVEQALTWSRLGRSLFIALAVN
jgi:hypothetical protein